MKGGGSLTSRSIRLIPTVLHSRQSLCNPLKEGLDVMPSLCRSLDEHDFELLCLLLAFFCCHLSFIVQICLVPHEDYYDVVPSLATDVVYPFGRVEEGVSVYR